MARKKKGINIAVFDFETDPFKYDRKPLPFCWGLRIDESNYISYWNDNHEICIKKLFEVLDEIEKPLTIFAHNGGKFDFMYFFHKFTGDIKIVNGRIIEAHYKHHTFRDSYAMMPTPLKSSGDKLDIDYRHMESDVRHLYKDEILEYLKADCDALYKMVFEFIKTFGDKLTIGGAAMAELKKLHPFKPVSRWFDEKIRPYYFGGRCQAFEFGALTSISKFLVYDVNSMYPYTMKNMRHPIGDKFYYEDHITDETAFIRFVGRNKGALPIRTKKGLDFNVDYGEFYCSIHEYNVALENNLISVDKIIETINFVEWTTFDKFVDKFFGLRDAAKHIGDAVYTLLYKLILNAAYGKFAQSPDNYMEWTVTDDDVHLDGYKGEHCQSITMNGKTLWGKPAEMKNFFNVAVAASITGAARSVLLAGLVNAKRPVYCDTDAIICEALDGVAFDKYELGAWDLEAIGDKLYIAGKKLYALYDGDNCVKMAAKGVSVVPLDIYQFIEGEPDSEKIKAAKQIAKNIGGKKIILAAHGTVVQTYSPAPNLKMNGSAQFVNRKIRRLA